MQRFGILCVKKSVEINQKHQNMKRILLLTAIICLSVNIFAQKSAQSIKYEGVLAQVITQDRYDKLQRESPAKLVATYYEATRFCYVSDKLPENARVMGDLCDFISPNEVCDNASAVVATQQLNHRKYTMVRDEVLYNAYAIGNTGFYAIVYPMGVYAKNYNAFMKEYGF